MVHAAVVAPAATVPEPVGTIPSPSHLVAGLPAKTVAGGDAASPMAGEEPAGRPLVLTIPGPDRVRLRMRRIPTGVFAMGAPEGEEGRDGDEGPKHEVVISRPFHLGIHEVTQQQWEAVMGNHPSKAKGNPRHPVEQVSWEDCQEFIKKLNAMGIGTFRLPTEAEWEYACRAGSQAAYAFGDDDAKLGEYAWYRGNSGNHPHEVGAREPNAWGLYDMHGNVSEWCGDWYDKYVMDRQADPAGPADGTRRVSRGGSWSLPSAFCRSANRDRASPDIRDEDLGFRLVREISE
jgi:formylglycine-generating enzyme required for sulfatase activity